MIKRIVFVIAYFLCVPLLLLSSLLILPLAIIALFRYIIYGDKEDKLMDFILFPTGWVIELPYKIMGK